MKPTDHGQSTSSASEMTCIVSGGALNSTHSLTQSTTGHLTLDGHSGGQAVSHCMFVGITIKDRLVLGVRDKG